MEIHLRRLDRLVSEPKRDDRAIDAVLEEVHGCSVGKHVRCYVLPPEGRTAPPGDIAVAGHQVLDGIPAQRPAAAAREHWSLRFAGALPEPRLHDLGRLLTEGRAALLPPLSFAAYVGAWSQDDVVAAEADQFRHSQSPLDRHQQESLVPSPDPSGCVGGGDQGGGLPPPG